MLRIGVSALVLSALGAAAVAAPLSGTVIDGASLGPVAGAKLSVAAAGIEISADIIGRYRFADLPVGLNTIRIEAEGYEGSSEEIELGDEGREGVVFILLRPGEYAEVIEVTEAAPDEPEPPGKQNLEREELTLIPGARGDALTTLKNLPGVANVNAAGSGPGLLVIRGSAPEDSKITIDGIQVPLIYHFFGLQSIIPSEFIESIDFLPGGFGVEDGRATGGLININTRSNEVAEIEGFAELSFINFAGFIQGPVSRRHNLHFAAGLRRSTIDAILPLVLPDDVNLAFVTAPQYYDAQLRFDYRPSETNQVWLFGMFSYDLMSLLNDEINPNEPLATGKFDNEVSFSRVIGGWRYDQAPIESRLSLSAGAGSLRIEIGTERYLRVGGYQLEAREDASLELLPEVELGAGVELRYQRGDVEVLMPLFPAEGSGGLMSFSTAPPIELNANTTNHTAGAYFRTTIKPTPTTTIIPGLRVDYYERISATTWLPRVSLAQGLGADWTLRAALGAYSRPLDGSEAIPTYLEPELATQYVAGVEYQVAEGVTASAAGFYTDRRQLVTTDTTLAVTDPDNALVNRGFGRSFGAEAMVRAKLEHFFGWVAYTVSRSDRVDSPSAARRLFDFDQTHNFIIVASYNLGQWNFGGRWQYNTGRPLTPVLGSAFLSDFNIYLPVLGEINSDRIAAAHQLDVRVDRKFTFATWQLSAYLDVTNAYYHPRTLGYRYNFDYSEREAIKELPILPALGVRGSF